jgi:2-desacetyl-2-hydroxyethyl bacteriochlorophyllide A dehydrogenase
MRAVIVEEPDGPLEFVGDLEIPELAPGEVVVRVTHCGVCHSDLDAWRTSLFGKHPIVLGHEGAGVIDEVGPGVTSVEPGDPVVIAVAAVCGQCYFCSRGQPTLCEQHARSRTNRRYRRGSIEVQGMFGVGALSERAVVLATRVVKVPPDTPLDVASLLACGVGTGLGAVFNTAQVPAGATMLVVGCGGVGLASIQAGRMVGASAIIGVDTVAERREAALRFGATRVVDPSQEDIVAVAQEVCEYGVDHALDTTGLPQVFGQCLRAIRRGGVLTLIGVAKQPLVIDEPNEFLLRERKVQGCAYGSIHPQRDIPRYLKAWRSGELDLEGLITARRPLSELHEALDDLDHGRGLRTIISLEQT